MLGQPPAGIACSSDSLWESTSAHVSWTSHASPIDGFGADGTNDDTGPLTPTTDDEDDANALDAYYRKAIDDEHRDVIEQAATMLRVGTADARQRAQAVLLDMTCDDRVEVYDKSVCHFVLASLSTQSFADVFYHARKTVYCHRLLQERDLDTPADAERCTRAYWLMWAARRATRLDIQGLYRQLINLVSVPKLKDEESKLPAQQQLL